MNRDTSAANGDEVFLEDVPLAMAYVRMQQWNEIYEPPMAFERATLFPELDKPFMGRAVD